VNFDTQPQRTWVSHDPESKIRCHLGLKGRVTLGDLYRHFAEHYPDVDFWNVEWAAASATWEDEPTEAERKQRAEWVRKQRERTENWERKTYERLRAKFEPRATDTQAAQEATS
jgi:hypothetical protein